MKKTISRIGCFLLAILLGLYSVAIPADADALSPGEWFVTGYYRVTSDGVMGYNGRYVMDGGAQEIESSLYAGQVVYAKVAYSSMGITWYCCFSEEEHSPDAIYYGCFLLSTSWTRTRTRAGNRSTNGSPDNSRYNNNYYNHHNDHDHNSYFYNCNYSFYYDRTNNDRDNYDNNTSNCTSQSQAKFSFYF